MKIRECECDHWVCTEFDSKKRMKHPKDCMPIHIFEYDVIDDCNIYRYRLLTKANVKMVEIPERQDEPKEEGAITVRGKDKRSR